MLISIFINLLVWDQQIFISIFNFPLFHLFKNKGSFFWLKEVLSRILGGDSDLENPEKDHSNLYYATQRNSPEEVSRGGEQPIEVHWQRGGKGISEEEASAVLKTEYWEKNGTTRG